MVNKSLELNPSNSEFFMSPPKTTRTLFQGRLLKYLSPINKSSYNVMDR